MTRLFAIALFLVSATLHAGDPAGTADVVIGQTLSLQSDILDETRTIKAWLPEDYADSGKAYPVFYLLDAEMTMRFAKAAATVAEFGGSRTPEMIVVGVENTDRGRDMFPARGGAGGADNFLVFLTAELAPFVDDTFRSNGYRILTGHSNSALFVTYALLTRPDSFNAYFAISPMLGHREPEMLGLAGQAFDGFPERHTYLYVAYGEYDFDRVLDVVPQFLAKLEGVKPASLVYRAEVLPGEGHVPYPSYGDALLALFPDFQLRDEQLAGGPAAIDAHYHTLSQRYGFEIVTPADALLEYGNLVRGRADYAGAIAAYELVTERFPGSEPAYFLLGRAHEGAGNTEQALQAYRTFLEMRPEVTSVKARIAELEKASQAAGD